MIKFLRRSSDRYVKLGLRRKKNQQWRKPTGRDNKMREKRRGYPAVVQVGYIKDKDVRGKVKEKIPVKVHNLKDLEKIGKENGCRVMVCETQNTNVPAIRFYRNIGFEVGAVDLSYYTNNDLTEFEVAVFMKRFIE